MCPNWLVRLRPEIGPISCIVGKLLLPKVIYHCWPWSSLLHASVLLLVSPNDVTVHVVDNKLIIILQHCMGRDLIVIVGAAPSSRPVHVRPHQHAVSLEDQEELVCTVRIVDVRRPNAVCVRGRSLQKRGMDKSIASPRRK